MSKTYNSVKHFISTFLVLALIFCVLPTAAFAAADSGDDDTLTVSIGDKKYTKYDELIDQLRIFPSKANATYNLVISDTSVLSACVIDSPFPEDLNNFKYVKITGLKVGTAVITVNEVYNGKTSAIDKITVTVVDSYLTTVDNEKHEYGLGRHLSKWSVVNQNVGAEYVFTVDKAGLTVTMTDNKIWCDSTAVGDYKVTATENYNGVSKVLGTVDIHVLPMTVIPAVTLTVGDSISLRGMNDGIILNSDNRYVYEVESDGMDINIASRSQMPITFAAAVVGYNYNHPDNPFPVDKCFVYPDYGILWARLAGTQVIHVYKVHPDRLEAPVLIGDCTVTVLPDPTVDPAIPTVPAVPCKATLDGTPVVLDAYLFQENGGGANYVMLRDVAFLLNGTKAQFDVGWTAKDGITLTTNTSYASMEKVYKDYDPKPYTSNTSAVTIDGKAVELTAYTIEGNNYFKLRDLGVALGFGVDWDGTTGTVVINTAN